MLLLHKKKNEENNQARSSTSLSPSTVTKYKLQPNESNFHKIARLSFMHSAIPGGLILRPDDEDPHLIGDASRLKMAWRNGTISARVNQCKSIPREVAASSPDGRDSCQEVTGINT